MQKILQFYRFTPLVDPDAIRLWQRTLCESLGLTGRILLGPHGINGTVGGELEALKRYVRVTKEYEQFRDIRFGWTDGSARDFPRLVVKVREEIVTFGAADRVKVTADGIAGGGTKLSPEQLHALVAERGDELTFFDGRNEFEARVGRFAGAVVPPTRHTRDFIGLLDSGAFDDLKNGPVVTYCTGGVRCEVLSALMIERGFEEVYQLDGGIAAYGAEFGDNGLWQGSMYVFDGRETVQFSSEAKEMGNCARCGAPTHRFIDSDDDLRERILDCGECAA